MKNYRLLQPGDFMKLHAHIKDTLPDAVKDPRAFAQIFWAKSSIFFELGKMEGAVWFVDVSIGWKASIHVVLWDESLRHKPLIDREMLTEIMELLQLRKVEAYIPVGNKAVNLAVKVGFQKEGVLNQWDRYNGHLVDIAVYSFVKES